MEEVFKQLLSLIIFILTGIVIGILFDCFRILRKSFKTKDWLTYIQDIIFWILTGAIILFAIFKFNNGEIRGYIILGAFFGVLLYMLTISKFFVKYSVLVIQQIKRIISFPIHIISNIIVKIIINPIKLITQKIKLFINNKIQKATKGDKNIINNE